jgi:isoleucyl-tRNA synthetase
VDPEEMIKKYGSDIVRLWAASCDYHVDVRCSDAIFRQLSEVYRKIRNTARILLANLGDFNPDTDAVAMDDLQQIDKWIIARTNDLTKTCREAYETYEFHIAYQAINNFCTNDLSKLYVDITKDRLYTEGKTSLSRRAGQTAMYTVLSMLTRLVAPILCFTAEEIWKCMPHAQSEDTRSVFLNSMPAYDEALTFCDVMEKWNKLFEMRDDVMKALEIARAEKLVGKSLEAKVALYTKDAEMLEMLRGFGKDLNTVFIVSGVSLCEGDAPAGACVNENGSLAVLVENADGCKCDRCWSYSTEGDATEDGGFICERCKKILG